jgi:endonuclease I
MFSMTLNAQIPDGYYNSADGLTGEPLKSALHQIIQGHTRFPYTATGTDVWDILKVADEDPDNSNNIFLIYTGRSQAKTENSGENPTYTGDRWNREHLWSKSHGFPSESDTAYTDCHHLRAADESVNTVRSNRDFDEGGVEIAEAPGCYYDNANWSFQVRDEVRGDVARSVFYMVVRYDPGFHSDGSTYDLEMVDYSNTDPDNLGNSLFGKLTQLYAWNLADPVDDAERARNEVIFGFQHNRNPFIDHPEYADLIWGDGVVDEPANHAADFSAHTIVLNWTDATGAVLPDGYLIKMSSVGYNDIALPVDGVPVADDQNNKNVAFGVGTCTFGGLTPGVVYYFKIFDYTGNSTTIDYKTDGQVPEINQVAN